MVLVTILALATYSVVVKPRLTFINSDIDLSFRVLMHDVASNLHLQTIYHARTSYWHKQSDMQLADVAWILQAKNPMIS